MHVRSGFAAVAIGALLLSLSGCKDEPENASAEGNNPPTISGSPKTRINAGSRYEFTPVASDPDDQPLKFDISGRPAWASFDPATGKLSGTPATGDVGRFDGVTISVSDGDATKALQPFTIRVDPASATSTPPPPMPSAGGSYRFAEIPEIVFVRGYRDSEHLGIFHVDTLNRWTPGDLDNAGGWKPRVTTQLEVVTGSLTGVSYDATTGILGYDGSGTGTETAHVRLAAAAESATSEEFNVRVLAPTIAWGADAARRFPGIGYDSGSVPWQDMRRHMHQDASYAEPNVLIVTPGRYSEDLYLAKNLLNLYIIGEPGGRPVLAHDGINLDGLETAYLKNLELEDTTVHTSLNLADRITNVYVTRVYQHDSTRDDNGFKASPGSPDPNGGWRYWFWNFHGSQMGWQSNLRHQMYIEGRLDSRLYINNIRITGSKECSAVKATRPFVSIRNSYLSAVLDENNLAAGMRSDKVVDLASAAQIVIYNNELVGAFSQERWGVSDGLLFLRARRGMWGADSPAYPDVSLDPPVSSVRPGFAPPGFTAGPETFVDPVFWDTVRSHDVADPDNPYTFKKYVAYNRFRWLDEEGEKRFPAFRDDGTAPREAAFQGSAAEYWGTVPANWTERSVTFFADNRYEGWLAQDLSDPRRWFALDNHPEPSLVTKLGPGPWPYPPPPRTAVFVGGEQRPGEESSPVEIPDWFRL
jgi:hypothetical protein